MTIYEFMSAAINCMKMTSPCINLITLVTACAMLEERGQRPTRILIPERLFRKLEELSRVGGRYGDVLRTRNLFGAEIEVQEDGGDPVVTVVGDEGVPWSKVMIYVDE